MTYLHKNVAKQIVAVGTKSSLAPEDTRICNEDAIHGTYVVTEIKTGFRAFLLFESHVTNGENKNEVESKLKQAIQEIPSLLMENNSSLSDFTDKIMFKFYGDAVVYPAPITYHDAIKLFEKLPQMSIENEQVISFSITPISDYCPEINTESTFHEISNNNIQKIDDMLMDFEQVEIFFKTILKSTRLAQDFQAYRQVLCELEKEFEIVRNKFSSDIQLILPKIRAGTELEEKLTTILQEYDESPFKKDVFIDFLHSRRNEIEIAEFLVYDENLPSKVIIEVGHSSHLSKGWIMCN